MRLLVVDDDETNRLVVRLLMGLRGWSVIEAESAGHAASLLATEAVDAIFMDIQMPEVDGYEATARLRRDPRLEDVPVLALTAQTTEEVRRRCLESGMNGFLRKPFDAGLAEDVSLLITRQMKQRAFGSVGWIVG